MCVCFIQMLYVWSEKCLFVLRFTRRCISVAPSRETAGELLTGDRQIYMFWWWGTLEETHVNTGRTLQTPHRKALLQVGIELRTFLPWGHSAQPLIHHAVILVSVRLKEKKKNVSSAGFGVYPPLCPCFQSTCSLILTSVVLDADSFFRWTSVRHDNAVISFYRFKYKSHVSDFAPWIQMLECFTGRKPWVLSPRSWQNQSKNGLSLT